MRRKCCRRRAHSGQVLLGPDQAQQSGMAVVVDVGVLERDFQQLIERTRRPFRLGECVLILRELDLVAFGLLGSSRQRLNPMRLRLVAGLERVGVLGVVEILAWHNAEKEHVVRLAGQRQPMPLDLLGRQILYCEIVVDNVQDVALGAFDRHRDKAHLERPIVVFGWVQPGPIVDVADLLTGNAVSSVSTPLMVGAFFDLNFSAKLGFLILVVRNSVLIWLLSDEVHRWFPRH